MNAPDDRAQAIIIIFIVLNTIALINLTTMNSAVS